MDDVNYLLGKRRYTDGFPEAVYARLPKNFDDPSLSTFASRLRVNRFYDGNPQQYDPKPSYSEGKITGELTALSGVPNGPSAIITSIKNYYALDPDDTTTTTSDPNFGIVNNFSGAIGSGSGFDILQASEKCIGIPATGTTDIRSSVRMKVITGTNANSYSIEVLESELKTVRPEGVCIQPSITEEFVSYETTEGTPTAGQVKMAYQPRAAFSGVDTSAGQAARFEVIRTASTNRYVIKILTKGVTYNVGDQFVIAGQSLGGATGATAAAIPGLGVTEFSIGQLVTFDVTTAGSGYAVDDIVTANTGGASFRVTSVDGSGGITGLEFEVDAATSGGSGYTLGTPVNIVGGDGLAQFTPTYVYDGANSNDLIIHVLAVKNSGEGIRRGSDFNVTFTDSLNACLLYTSPSPRD